MIALRTVFAKQRQTGARRVTLEHEPDGAWRVIGLRRSADAADRASAWPKPSRCRSSHAPPAAARPIWNPAKQKLVCPFCGTESPAQARSPTGAIVEHDLVAALRGIGDDARGWQADEAAGQVPELQRDLGARSDAAGAELRILRLGAARAVRGDRSPRSGPESVLPFKVSRSAARAIASARGTASCGSRRTALEAARADRHRAAASTCRTGRSTRSVDADVDGRGRPLLLHDRDLRDRAAARRRGRCSTCAGSRRPGSCQHFFDDDLVCASVGVHPNLLRGIEPFPTHELKPYDAGYVAGLGRRALPDRSRRRRAARARRDGREAAGAVRAAGSRRHVSQSRRARRLTRGRRSSTSWRRCGS